MTAAPGPAALDLRAELVHAEFTRWFGAQRYTTGAFEADSMAEAFEGGMNAQAALAAPLIAASQQQQPAPGGHDAAELQDRISILSGALHEIQGACKPGTYAHDIAHEALDQSGGLTPPAQPAPRPPFTEWAVFWGGVHPGDCAGLNVYDDETQAEESCQWIESGGIAKRTATRGPWTVTRPPVAPEPPPWDSLSAEDRERFQQWLVTQEAGQ